MLCKSNSASLSVQLKSILLLMLHNQFLKSRFFSVLCYLKMKAHYTCVDIERNEYNEKDFIKPCLFQDWMS